MFFAPNIKFTIDFSDFYGIILFARADVMELADLTDSKSVAFAGVRVRPPPSAPNKNKTNPRENLEFVLFFTRDYFGLKIKL